MSWDGYLGWDVRFLRSKPWVAGAFLTDGIASLSSNGPGAGFAIELLAGNHVGQVAARPDGAPLSLHGEPVELTVQQGNEDDYFRIRRLRALCGLAPVEVFLEDPIEDVWVIPEAAKTTWTLSRSFPYGSVGSYATRPPQAWVVDNPTGANPDALTPVTSGPPAADEFVVDDTANGTSIETDDLSAEVGRLLVLRYHPMRLYVLAGLSREVPEPNGLDYTLSLTEVVPAGRSY